MGHIVSDPREVIALMMSCFPDYEGRHKTVIDLIVSDIAWNIYGDIDEQDGPDDISRKMDEIEKDVESWMSTYIRTAKAVGV